MSYFGKVNIVSDVTDKTSATTLIEFRNQYYRIFTPCYPDGSPMQNIVNKANHEGFVAHYRPNLMQNSRRIHSNAIVAFEEKLLADHRAKQAKVNARNRERADAMRLLGLKRAPGGAFGGWE